MTEPVERKRAGARGLREARGVSNRAFLAVVIIIAAAAAGFAIRMWFFALTPSPL